jgi:hypothetical protein
VSTVPAQVPASIVRRDAFFSDPWWTHADVRKSDPPPAPDPAKLVKRPDGSVVLSETVHQISLLDGRKAAQIRRVLRNPRGRRFKEFLIQMETKDKPQQVSMAEVAPLLPLYAVERFDPGTQAEIVVTEGVAAAEALIGMGLAAAGTLTGALHTPTREALAPASRFSPVYLWPDNDSIGVRHMERVAERLWALGARDIRVIRWLGGPRKGDAADFQEAAEGVRKLMEDARKWKPGSSVRYRGQLATHAPRMPVALTLPPGARTPRPAILPQAQARVAGVERGRHDVPAARATKHRKDGAK